MVISSIAPINNNVAVGQNTSFTVAATGTGLTYQWQVNDGSGFANLADDAVYSGSNSATLAITSPTGEMSGFQYQCIVTGTAACTAHTSEVASLNVDTTGIVTQPVSVAVCEGSNAAFTTVAESVDPDQEITYYWEVKVGTADFVGVSEGFDATTGLTFTGSDSSTLSMSGTTVANSNLVFHCIVNGYIYSSDANLTVNQPTVITANPANQTVCVTGGTATFSATATGTSLAYQWQVSTDNGSSWTNVSGATAASLTVTNPALTANGSLYHVVVSGAASCPSATSTAATLYINNPTITSQPSAAVVVAGNTATYTVAASAATSYQWQRATTLNGAYTNVVDATPTGVTYTGATSASLSVVTSSATAAGSANFYRCIVTNNGCTVTSTGAQLTVNTYCASGATNTGDEEIYSVTVNGSSTAAAYANANGCTTAAPGAGSVLSSYSNFTSWYL